RVAVGFGVRAAEQAAVIAAGADGVVVGAALGNALKASLDQNEKTTAKTVTAVVKLVAELARGGRSARRLAGGKGAKTEKPGATTRAKKKGPRPPRPLPL